MSEMKYCQLKCEECPTCPVCGIGGSCLFTPGCKGCTQRVSDTLKSMTSDERRIVVKRIFLYRKIETEMTQEELDILISAIREEIVAEQILLKN